MKNLIIISFKSIPFIGIALAISFLITGDQLFLIYLAPLLVAYSLIYVVAHLVISFSFGLFADYEPSLVIFDVIVISMFVLFSSIAFWSYLMS